MNLSRSVKHSVRCGLKINVELGKSFILFTFCIDGGKINYRCTDIGEWVDVVKIYVSSLMIILVFPVR